MDLQVEVRNRLNGTKRIFSARRSDTVYNLKQQLKDCYRRHQSRRVPRGNMILVVGADTITDDQKLKCLARCAAWCIMEDLVPRKCLPLSLELDLVITDFTCAVCGSAEDNKTCASCRQVFCCSHACQREHWAIHKLECQKACHRL